MNNKLFISFDFNPSVEYSVILGNTYSDNFNEEIDSITIELDGISKLNFNEPYHFCKIRNSDTENGLKWNNKSFIFMLIDTWVETETSFEGIYDYKFTLMNCIKILEKIQCPDRVITHSLVSDRKTILDYIEQYLNLYGPKVKITYDGVNWSYDSLIRFDKTDSMWNKFKVPCADMQFNEPTLRELLTHLMLQVDCIPTMEYRSLKYIDFKENPTPFTKKNNTFITESGASDSYNTSITVSPSQILDSGNRVISENIGFRDRKNAIISQLQNLQIETRFPIYKVEKLILRNMVGYQLFWPINEVYDGSDRTGYPRLITLQGSPVGDYDTHFYQSGGLKLRLVFKYLKKSGYSINYHTGKISKIKVHFCTYSNGKYTEETNSPVTTGDTEWSLTFDGADERKITTGFTGGGKTQELLSDGTIGSDVHTLGTEEWRYFINLSIPTDIANKIINDGPTSNNNLYIWFENEFEDTYLDKKIKQFVPVRPIIRDNNSTNYIVMPEPNRDNIDAYYDSVDGTTIYKIPFQLDKGTQAIDLTPLVYEQSKRQLLNTNYVEMASATTLEEFSQYIYATMGYTIGDNKITGFSSSYSRAQMWWNKTESYIDNIVKFYIDHNLIETIIENENSASVKYLSERNGNMPISSYSIYSSSTFEIDNSKGKYFFSITYQPLNNFKLKLPKENKNIPLDLTTLNQTESGLSDFDRFIKNNQSMSNRTGNKIIQLPVIVNNISELMPLNSIYQDKYVVFKRNIEINSNYLSVLYTMAEKFVMQNYFTSIITKYRAYEYVDYEQSVIRKECVTIYCKLDDKKYYPGADDHIKWMNDNTSSSLISGLKYSGTQENGGSDNNSISYVVRRSTNNENNEESTKEELSTITYDNGLAIIFQEFDNVSAGLYLESYDFPEYNDTSIPGLGGVEQSWQRWKLSDYNRFHEIFFVSDILVTLSGSVSEYTLTNILINYPILKSQVKYEDFVIFKLVTEQNGYAYAYYKDNAEIINQTVQFHFYGNDVLFSQNLFDSSELVNKINNYRLYVMLRSDFAITSEEKTITGDEEIEQASGCYSIDFDTNINLPYINVKWSDIDSECITVIITDRKAWSQVTKYRELITFRKNGRTQDTKYYLTLNNTQTDDVWYFYDNFELFKTYECTNGVIKKCNIKS